MFITNDTTHLTCSEMCIDIVFKLSLERDFFTDMTSVCVIQQCNHYVIIYFRSKPDKGADRASETSCCVY